MGSAREIELAQADVCYCHDRVALLRAKLYRSGLRPNARRRELERQLQPPSNTCAMSVRAKRVDTFLTRRLARRFPLGHEREPASRTRRRPTRRAPIPSHRARSLMATSSRSRAPSPAM
jgi:hypothetical protein